MSKKQLSLQLHLVSHVERHQPDVLGDDVAVEHLRAGFLAVGVSGEHPRLGTRRVDVVFEVDTVHGVFHVEGDRPLALQQHPGQQLGLQEVHLYPWVLVCRTAQTADRCGDGGQ